MTKTPEQMAEEYSKQITIQDHCDSEAAWYAEKDFLAGYKAAMESYATKLEEANATIDGLADECEGLKSILYDHDETNLPTPAKWISVKERLPEEALENQIVLVWRASWHDYDTVRWKSYNFDDVNSETITHWMPLPEAPKGEK